MVVTVGVTVTDPDIAPPELKLLEVQLVAPVTDQESTSDVPRLITGEEVVSIMTGAGAGAVVVVFAVTMLVVSGALKVVGANVLDVAGFTISVADAPAVPPGPEQEILYVVETVGDTPIEEPLDPPVRKLVPVHDVALVENHVSVAEPPAVID